MQARLGITGLTGPGEPWFGNSVGIGAGSGGADGDGRLHVRGSYSDNADGEGGAGAGGGGTGVDEDEAEDYKLAKRLMPSVFSELKVDDDALDGGGEEEDEVDEEDMDASYRERKNKFGWDLSNYKDPTELDGTASAAEVVQAWAFRLKGE